MTVFHIMETAMQLIVKYMLQMLLRRANLISGQDNKIFLQWTAELLNQAKYSLLFIKQFAQSRLLLKHISKKFEIEYDNMKLVKYTP